MPKNSKTPTKAEKPDARTRQMRTNQIIFGIIALLIILSMTLSLFVNV